MTTIDRDEPNITLKVGDEYQEVKEQMTQAFEIAVSYVGRSFRSDVIWQDYFNFIRSWPEESDQDRSLKEDAIYNLYKRVVQIPVNGLENFWKDYVKMEKSKSIMLPKQAADKVINDAQEIYEKRTMKVLEARRQFIRDIDFDRIALPACNDSGELKQLDAWNEWIKYELTNPLGVDQAVHYQHVTFLYQQALSSLRFHPEVWLAFADFVFENEDPKKSINILEVAISNIPTAVVLRLHIAEIEERMETFGADNDAKVGGKRKLEDQNEEESRSSSSRLISRLQKTFFEIPSAFTFSLWQRAVRQERGIRAGRECFKETSPLRAEYSSLPSIVNKGDNDHLKLSNKEQNPTFETRRLAYEIYFAHSQLELEVNKDAEVALRILYHAKKLYPKMCVEDIDYTQLLVKILLQLGNYEQLRWHFQNLLQLPDKIVVGKAMGFPGGLVEGDAVGDIKRANPNANSVGNNNSLLGSSLLLNLTKRQRLHLLKQYYALELKFGQASTSTLNELRKRLQHLQEEAKIEMHGGSGLTSTVVDINDIHSTDMNLDDLDMSGNNERRITSALLHSSPCTDATKTDSTMVIMKTAILIYERFGYAVPRGKLPKEDYMLMQRCFLKDILDETLRNDRLKESQDDPMRRSGRKDDKEIEKVASRLQLPTNLANFLYKLPHQTNVTISSELFVERLRKSVLPLRPSDTHRRDESRDGRSAGFDDNMDVRSAAPVVEDVFKQRARKRLEKMQQFSIPV